MSFEHLQPSMYILLAVFLPSSWFSIPKYKKWNKMVASNWLPSPALIVIHQFSWARTHANFLHGNVKDHMSHQKFYSLLRLSSERLGLNKPRICHPSLNLTVLTCTAEFVSLKKVLVYGRSTFFLYPMWNVHGFTKPASCEIDIGQLWGQSRSEQNNSATATFHMHAVIFSLPLYSI